MWSASIWPKDGRAVLRSTRVSSAQEPGADEGLGALEEDLLDLDDESAPRHPAVDRERLELRRIRGE